MNNNKHQGSSSLNEEVGVLKRREIEAAVLGPLLRKIEQQLGRTKTRALLQETIIDIAKPVSYTNLPLPTIYSV